MVLATQCEQDKKRIYHGNNTALPDRNRHPWQTVVSMYVLEETWYTRSWGMHTYFECAFIPRHPFIEPSTSAWRNRPIRESITSLCSERTCANCQVSPTACSSINSEAILSLNVNIPLSPSMYYSGLQPDSQSICLHRQLSVWFMYILARWFGEGISMASLIHCVRHQSLWPFCLTSSSVQFYACQRDSKIVVVIYEC